MTRKDGAGDALARLLTGAARALVGENGTCSAIARRTVAECINSILRTLHEFVRTRAVAAAIRERSIRL